MLRRCLPAVLVLLAACGSREPAPADPADAEAALGRMEASYAAIAGLPAAERTRAEAGFGPELERAVAGTRGTRFENKALYWQAQWLLATDREHGHDRAEPVVDRLESLEYPAYKVAARMLRLQIRLRQGKVAEARMMIDEIATKIPEFAAVAQREVAFAELAGRPAPSLKPVTPGAGDPAAAAEPLLLVLFCEGAAASTDLAVQPWLAAAADPALAGQVRVVGVFLAADPVGAAGAAVRWRRPGLAVETLRADAGPSGDLERWRADWHLPHLPCAVLIGPPPHRLVLAADPAPGDLRRAAGLP